jgi:DNA-binding SARP family transcriptional activator/LysM repeat protein
VAAALFVVGGPPRFPVHLPDWRTVVFTLRGTDVPIEALGYLFTSAAWLLWLWLAGSLALRLVVVAAEALTHGAAWLRSLRSVSDRVTLPFVRRLVDGAVVATVVINLVGRATPSAYAAPLGEGVAPFRSASVGDPTARDEPRADVVAPLDRAPRPADQVERPVVLHTVVSGDTLWAISERYFGTGFAYARIVDANAGRRMPDGRLFTRAGVIQPGWVLRIPQPDAAVDELDGERTYVVAPGDTLCGIAARALGNEAAWSALFEANRGARLPDGRTLTDPNLIWPGLRLRLPAAAGVAAASVDVTTTSAPPAASVGGEAGGLSLGDASATAPDPSSAVPTGGEEAGQERQARQDGGSAPVSPRATPDGSTTTAPLPAEPAPLHRPGSPEGMGILELVAGAGAAASAGLLGRRYWRSGVRRRLSVPPAAAARRIAEDVAVHDGFAEAEFGRQLAHRLLSGEGEPAVVGTEHVGRYLRECGLNAVAVVTAVQGREASGLTLDLTLRARLADQERLLGLAPVLGSRLGGTGQATRTADDDLVLSLAGLRPLGFLTPVTPPAPDGDPLRGATAPPVLIPVGALSRRHVLYANWRALGNVLVAGTAGGGPSVILSSLVAALAARCHPRSLRLLRIGSGRALPARLAELPHWKGRRVDPADPAAVGALLDGVRTELVRRIRGQHGDRAEERAADRAPEHSGATAAALPALVLVVEELAELGDGGLVSALLDAVGSDGPDHGVYVVAATTRPERVDQDVLAHFGTRLVLQVPDVDRSIQLLGTEDAVELAGGGALLLRIDGRAPVWLRGFRVSEAHLEQLVAVLREAYGAPVERDGAPGRGPADVAGGVQRSADAPPPAQFPAEDSATDADGTDGTGGARRRRDAEPAERGDGPPGLRPGGPGVVTSGQQARGVSPVAAPAAPAAAAASDGDGTTAGRSGCGAHPDAAQGATDGDEWLEESAEGPSAALRAWLDGLPDALADGVGNAGEVGGAGGVEGAGGDRQGDIRDRPPPRPVAAADVGASAASDAGPVPGGPLLQVRCFGSLRVFHGDQELTPKGKDVNRHRPWEALAYLAARPDGCAMREKMLNDLWPNVADYAAASNRLDTNLVRLRKVLAHQVPEVTGDVVRADRGGVCRLDAEMVWSDVREFVTVYQAAVAAPPAESVALYERARALYQADLFSGTPYAWIYERDTDGVTLQERYREMFLQATNELARLYREAGEPERAAPLYRSLLRAEPTYEDVARSLYRCYEEMGDRSALIREHRQLRQALRDAYARMDPADVRPEDREPEPETVLVYEEVFAALERQEAACRAPRAADAPAAASQAA